MPKIAGADDRTTYLVDFSVRMDTLDTVSVGHYNTSTDADDEYNFFQIYNEGWAAYGNHDLSL